MAGLYFETKLRPCYVYKTRKALFHGWSHKQMNDPSGTLGIVEYEDGTVGLVCPQRIRFIDNKFMDYSWEEKDH